MASFSPITETFDNGNLGNFNHTWGDVQGHDGYLSVTSPASTHELGVAMWAPDFADGKAGLSYGTYEFDVSTSNSVTGPYALLWPGSDKWPGPELDVFEIGGGGETKGKPYSTVHWDAGGNDAYDYQVMPGSIDPSVKHTYGLNWTPDALKFYVDGQNYRTETNNVPKDYIDGGENLLPGVGELTSFWADQNTTDNTLNLYEFRYTPDPSRASGDYAIV